MRLFQLVKNQFHFTKAETMQFFQNKNILVNGKEVKASYILEENDIIEIENEFKIQYHSIEEEKLYYLLNKPRGVICNNRKDLSNTIRDYFPNREDLFSVGRLDKDSCGLLILTNDGSIVNEINNPQNHIEKEYLVTFQKEIDNELQEAFEKGNLSLRGGITKPACFKQLDDFRASIILSQGLYRQIRSTAKLAGNTVIYLERVRIGCITNNGLDEGKIRSLTMSEIDAILTK